jgi:AraC family transcriptional activator of tynA and feaB
MGWGLALRGVKEAFAPFELARTPLPDDLLEDQLGTVLALASGTHVPRPVDHALLDRCMQATRDLLVQPGLTAEDVAMACAISVRTLHRTFGAAGQKRCPQSTAADSIAREQALSGPSPAHSTVTLFARFRGLSTSVPRAQAV